MFVQNKAEKETNEPVTTFDLKIARNATSLTDNMSTVSDEEEPRAEYALQGRDNSLVLSNRRSVSFSHQVPGTQQYKSETATLCLGSGKRAVRIKSR